MFRIEPIECNVIAKKQFRPSKGNILTTFPIWPKEYELRFELRYNRRRISLGDTYYPIEMVSFHDVHGQEIKILLVTVWIHVLGSYPYLDIEARINPYEVYKQTDDIWFYPRNWIKVSISQYKLSDNKYALLSYVNGKKIGPRVLNSNPAEFRNVTIFAHKGGDSMDGYLRNIEICFKGQ